MPLSVTAQEAVWRAVAQRMGISDLSDFLAGPPYLPFGWMGCLDGWGGPLPQSWIGAHITLQKKILARERELGMLPVLQGFTGHIPPAVIEKFADCTVQKIHWIEWETYMLDPLDPLFQKIGKMFIEEQKKLYGTNHLYAADSFIEMTPPKGDSEYLEGMAKSILEAMTAVDPAAIWVLQGWAFSNKRDFWTPQRLETFLTEVPNDHILVLDLFCEQVEMWRETESFYGKPWLWCMVQTFGANTDMHGPLNKMNIRIEAARKSPQRGNLTGIGFVNEGFEGNPVVYEFLTEMAWYTQAVDLNIWLDHYSRARYGIQNENLSKAWAELYQSVYSDSLDYGIFISANRYPRLRIGSGPSYNTRNLVEAWRLMLDAADLVKDCDTYAFDLTSVGIQVLANYSHIVHQKLLQTFKDQDNSRFEETAQLFLQLLGDLDELAATRPEFLLGRWLEDAKRWGTNEAEKALYEWNARRVLTLWGSGANLRDYSRRNWSGMFKGFYQPRWKFFIEEMSKSLNTGIPFDEQAVNEKILQWEAKWTEGMEDYSDGPMGNYLQVSIKMWRKYQNMLLSEL
jgi:alpha-N-acetylglucosaminidase